MATTAIKIGQADHGRRMSLAEFEHAVISDGFRCELDRGIVVVSETVEMAHLFQVVELRSQLSAYQHARPDRHLTIVSGGQCKILLEDYQSERHPDLAVYRAPAPEKDDAGWADWIPELVIEVVSPESRQRDYHEKREEYLAYGVLEYWIFDAERGEMLALQRKAGRWSEQIVRPPQKHVSRKFWGLELDCGRVFEAARKSESQTL